MKADCVSAFLFSMWRQLEGGKVGQKGCGITISLLHVRSAKRHSLLTENQQLTIWYNKGITK